MVETSLTCIKVKSDVFCNGALVLPDKAARVLSIGGWSVDSLYGVRLYLPDGEPGVNGTNDWEEDFSVLRLQVNGIFLAHGRHDSDDVERRIPAGTPPR